ncbi:MAG: cell division protein FtsL [Gammaproteobacteria bacterium]|nr:MAG: cell division protein FtsL [Gammaproteobacteria bacterium]UCH41597.1 MAG: cell division protein FtsL [Gammaproteobacteria bacterium]
MDSKLWFPLLLALVLGSALTVIYVKHQSQVLFAELRSVQKQQDRQVIEWGRLQLQNTTLATHSNVESRARKDLKMRLPEEVELVRLQ